MESCLNCGKSHIILGSWWNIVLLEFTSIHVKMLISLLHSAECAAVAQTLAGGISSTDGCAPLSPGLSYQDPRIQDETFELSNFKMVQTFWKWHHPRLIRRWHCRAWRTLENAAQIAKTDVDTAKNKLRKDPENEPSEGIRWWQPHLIFKNQENRT